MWSNVISIDKACEKEIDYMLCRLERTKEVSYAVEESKDRLWIYLAGMCERQREIEREIFDMLETVFLSHFKLNYFLQRLHIGRLTHASCAFVSSILHFDREFESAYIERVLQSCAELCVDGIFNFRLREIASGWDELVLLANRLLEGSGGDNDIFDIASFITGSEGKKNQLVLKGNSLRNLTERCGVEIVRLFDQFEFDMLNAIIREKPMELLVEGGKFSKPMDDALKKIVRVIEKA